MPSWAYVILAQKSLYPQRQNNQKTKQEKKKIINCFYLGTATPKDTQALRQPHAIDSNGFLLEKHVSTNASLKHSCKKNLVFVAVEMRWGGVSLHRLPVANTGIFARKVSLFGLRYCLDKAKSEGKVE